MDSLSACIVADNDPSNRSSWRGPDGQEKFLIRKKTSSSRLFSGPACLSHSSVLRKLLW